MRKTHPERVWNPLIDGSDHAIAVARLSELMDMDLIAGSAEEAEFESEFVDSAIKAVNDVRFTSVNVERIKSALASTIHEMPLGLTREERRAFILAAAEIGREMV